MNHYDNCAVVPGPVAPPRQVLSEPIGILKRADEALDLSKAVSYRVDRINALLTGAMADEAVETVKNVRSVLSNLVDTTDVLNKTMVALDKLICILEE